MLTARILTLINTDREGYEGCSTTIPEQMAANDDEEGKAFAQKSDVVFCGKNGTILVLTIVVLQCIAMALGVNFFTNFQCFKT